uniref:Uncharacterized protein n=1 Tax=Vespula pensylvanica TaxID=30213 RepID=A0A834NRV1_VESPE|nr:hypothetical protein H0235_011380 [Vespula pensylvanica]
MKHQQNGDNTSWVKKLKSTMSSFEIKKMGILIIEEKLCSQRRMKTKPKVREETKRDERPSEDNGNSYALPVFKMAKRLKSETNARKSSSGT